MKTTRSDLAIHGREDISRFIVHLTRDDSDDFSEGGATARSNFLSITKSRRIIAYRPHCLHSRRLSEVPENLRDRLSVACFTEVPLNQLHLLCRQIPGRRIELSPYGFVFKKDFFATAGGQPAVYVNSYDSNSWYREAFDQLFDIANDTTAKAKKLWRILPYLNAMHEKYDFSWEREWRIRKNLSFKMSDVVAVILPNEGEEELKKVFATSGTAVISPGWTYEQIVSELAKQQRDTKRITLKQAQDPPKTKA